MNVSGCLRCNAAFLRFKLRQSVSTSRCDSWGIGNKTQQEQISGQLFEWWRNAKPFLLIAVGQLGPTSHGLVRAHCMYKIVYMEKICRLPEATSDLKLSSLRLTTVALPWPRLSTRLPVVFSTLARFCISISAMSFRIFSSIRSRLPSSEMMYSKMSFLTSHSKANKNTRGTVSVPQPTS